MLIDCTDPESATSGLRAIRDSIGNIGRGPDEGITSWVFLDYWDDRRLIGLASVLEVYAIEIQMYSELRETKKLKVGLLVCLLNNAYSTRFCRTSTKPPSASAQQSPTRESWASSENAAARCGWPNARGTRHRRISSSRSSSMTSPGRRRGYRC
jgi:hypothetical protein